MARIAIVEDEFIVAMDIRHFLEARNHEVVGIYDSGVELLERFEEIWPELVLMDIQIKGDLDGVETSALVRDRYAIPVVLLTAYADEATVDRAKDAELYGYVIKPFEERALRTAIDMALYRAGMERRLRESEAKYRALFEGGPGCNFVVSRSGRIVEANDAFASLMGDSVGLDFASRFCDAGAFAALMETLDSGSSVPAAEYELLGANARPIVLFASFSMARDDADARLGRPWRLAQGFGIDATDRRQLEEQLRQAQKLEAVGRLAGGVAHDFNNVLTAVMGHADLLAASIGDRTDLMDDIEGVKRAARRAAALTRQLLGFARRRRYEPKVFVFDDLVRETESMLRRLLPGDIALICEKQAGETQVKADPAQMEQLLVNLVVNARDAMRGGGTIFLSTSRLLVDEPRSGAVGDLLPGAHACLRVSDSGIGMAEALIGRIFEPFFTTKGPDGGTGLGLATVASIVRQSQGMVEVRSAPGKGSTFTVSIPALASDRADGLAAEPAREQRGATRSLEGLVVLVVEDDEDVRDLVVRALTRAGCKVVSAASPGEGLLAAERLGPSVDLIVADLVLPLIGGDELAERIKLAAPHAAALVITGHQDREASTLYEATVLLRKPFEEVALLAALETALAQRDSAKARP